MMYDVVVIGAGLAGTLAAHAAQRTGARVALAARGYGATALSSGAIDLAYSPALSSESQLPRTIAEHVMDIVAHRPRHPFAVLGLEATLRGMREGYALLRELLADSDLQPPPKDFEAENHGLPSSLGTVLPSATGFGPHVGIDLAHPLSGRWGVLQLHGDASFDARRLGLGWQRDATALCGSSPEWQSIPVSYGADDAMLLAQRLDDQSETDRLASQLREHARGLRGLLAPPVLGLRRSKEVRARLAEAVGAPVIEALAHLPSVPGLRLQRALESAVQRAGIDTVGEITFTLSDGPHLRGVMTRDQIELKAGAFVLATGRFLSGGIRWEQHCEETLFGLPVVTELGPLEDDDPLPVVRELPTESHPLMTAGVAINAQLQPMREGRVAFDNLFAAGMVIGGFASRYALCSDGVACATGVLAAQTAVRSAGASS